MKLRTVCLPPGRIAPGMALAAPITGHDGQVLLASGTAVDSETLERLIRRGVDAIFVSVLDTRDTETIALEARAAQARVEFIFRGTGSRARDALRTSILRYRMEQAG